MQGLIIREPWISLILAGKKSWEMRSKPISVRGRLALIRKGSGAICGVAEIVDCLPALTADGMRQTEECHCIPSDQQADAIANGWTTPWVLRNVRPIEPSIPYVHNKGAVTLVNLSDDVERKVLAAMGVSLPKVDVRSQVIVPKRPTQSLSDPSPNSDIYITLTDGNIRNAHISLRRAAGLLPAAAIGGPNKVQIATQLVNVRFRPGLVVDTDIAGDKMIFRNRGAVRDFFERTGAKEGDRVRLRRVAESQFEVSLDDAPLAERR